MIKIYIEYQFKEGPYGGANQFLKSLRDYFVKNNMWSDNAEDADCILINHTNISLNTLLLKKICPEKIFIHRVDGPVSKHRKRSKALDKQSFFIDKMLFDGTVFQSVWTEESCRKVGYVQTGQTAVIHNAPDPNVFYKTDRTWHNADEKKKIKLIATSWSNNWNKGFDVFQYLDEHLDFERYDFTFVGRTPIDFKNIQQIQPLESKALAEMLRDADIYVAASRSESCSNSLIEAINCGLVVAARDSGCYKEVIREGGLLAKDAEGVLENIEKLAKDLGNYQCRLPYYDIDEIGEMYYNFINCVYADVTCGKQQMKKISLFNILQWKLYLLYIKVYQKLMRNIDTIANIVIKRNGMKQEA